MSRMILYSLFKNKSKKVKIKTWNTEYPIFEKRVKKIMQTIKYTKSIDTMIKNFENIKQEINYIMKYKPIDLDIQINEYTITNADTIDDIKNSYIRQFVDDRIDIELMKEQKATNQYIKAGIVKKALSIAIKAIEYFPQDIELELQIESLESKLFDCYKGEEHE